ncbi:MAG: MarR family winged helix-turn-helix transcriptional regulator [Actinomycetota bacterium]|nr:MarR family winged helix-turn-helix transcriptional regulator [Actinomycetota bacterium]
MLPIQLSYALHALTARMDASADSILRSSLRLPYASFLVLFAIDVLGDPTQRALAVWVNISEASLSRRLPGLAEAGWLEVRTEPGRGHRRQVVLTRSGRALVRRGRRLLEQRFAEVVRAAGVDYEEYAVQTAAVLALLEKP